MVNSIQGARRVPRGIQGWGQAWTDVANRGHDGVCGGARGQARLSEKAMRKEGYGRWLASDRDGAMVGARSKHTL